VIEIVMVQELKILEHFSTSDHNMIAFQFVLANGGQDAVICKYQPTENDFNDINLYNIFDDKGTLECYELHTFH